MCKKLKFDPYEQMGICTTQQLSWKMTHINSYRTWTYTNGSPNLGQKIRPYNNQHKKKGTCEIVDFAVPADHRIKLKEYEKKDKYLDLSRELKKTMEHEGDNYNNHDWCFWYSHQRFIKGTGGFGGRRTTGNHPNYNIIENGQNTEKSAVDLRRLAVTQPPVKNHQLILMRKTLKE